MSNDPTTAPADPNRPPAAAPPRRRRRWFRRLFVLGLVLLLIVAGLLVAVQLVLQDTDTARRIALPIVERSLGLRLSAEHLRVSLFGHTELTGVSAGLPLDKADFLHVPAIRVSHSNLLQIALSLGKVRLDDVEIDRPTVDVVQDQNGQWNLLQVVDILGKLGGSNNAQPTPTSGGVPQLPAVHLNDGTIKVADAKGHQGQVYPLDVSGQPTPDGLVFQYDLSAGPKGAELLKVGGRVAPGNSWTHEVTADAGHLDPLAKSFGIPSTYAASVSATWDGKLTDGKVGGRLTLERVSAAAVPSLGDVGVTGAVDVTTGGSAAPAVAGGGVAGPVPIVTLSPSNLIVATSSATLPVLGVRAGAIFYDDTGVHTRGLKVNGPGRGGQPGRVVRPQEPERRRVGPLDGPEAGRPASARPGSLTASLRQPFPGQPLVRVTVDDRGDIGGTAATAAAAAGDLPATAGTKWDAGVEVVGQGTSFNSIDWVLTVPRLNVDSKGKRYDLSGLSAQVQQRPTTIDLLGLTLPPAAGATSTTTVATTGGTATAGPGATKAAPADAASATSGGGSRSATAVPPSPPPGRPAPARSA